MWENKYTDADTDRDTVLMVVVLHQWRELPTDRVLVLVCWCIKADAAAAVDVAARSDSVLLEYSALSLSGTPVPVAEWPSGSLAAEPCLALFFGVFCVLLFFVGVNRIVVVVACRRRLRQSCRGGAII